MLALVHFLLGAGQYAEEKGGNQNQGSEQQQHQSGEHDDVLHVKNIGYYLDAGQDHQDSREEEDRGYHQKVHINAYSFNGQRVSRNLRNLDDYFDSAKIFSAAPGSRPNSSSIILFHASRLKTAFAGTRLCTRL